MTLPISTRNPTGAQLDAIYEDLRQGLDSLPTTANLNDRVRFCIGVCIENGIDTMRHIVGTVKKLGFDNRHIGAKILESTGTDPQRHLWSLGKDGRYRNLDIPSALPDMG